MTTRRSIRIARVAIIVGIVLALLAVGGSLWYYRLLSHHEWLERRLSDAVDRPVEIGGNLSVSWESTPGTGWRGWVPTPVVRAEKVSVGNASWAQQTHFASAEAVALHIPLLPLLSRTLHLNHVELSDARLHLERNPQGGGNWNFLFGRGGGGGGWRVDLGTVRLGGTSVQYTDTALQLDLTATLTAARAANVADATAFTLEGHYREAKLKGSGTAGSLLTLQDRAVNYPVNLELHAGEVAFTAQGQVGNLYVDPTVDLKVSVAAPSMTLLYPVTGLVLPHTAPFKTEGRLQGSLGPSQAAWTYRDFTGHMGDSDLSGTLSYESRPTRPFLQGQIRSEHLQLVDLRPLLGLEGIPADPAAEEPEARQGRSASSDQLIPNVPFLADRWQTMDIHVDYQADTLQHGKAVITRDFTANVRLQDQQLALTPLQLTLGGGSAQLNLTLDARERPVAGNLNLQVKQVALESLVEGGLLEEIGGTIQASAELAGHGESLAGLLDTSDGKLDLYLKDGHVRRTLVELAALDVLNAAFSKLFEDKDVVPITCAHAGFDVKRGVATARQFQVQTSIAYFETTGTVNLKEESLNLTVNPHTLEPRLFTLRSPLTVTGSLRHPKVGVEEGHLLLRAGAAAALGVLAAPLAILPLTDLGSKAPPCIEPQ